MLETDLRFTKDGEVVLVHDETLERTTNGRGNVADLTLKEIRQYRVRPLAGDEFDAEYVPTSSDLITLTHG